MLIIGRNPVLELLKSGKPVAKVYVRFGMRGDLLQELRRAARERRVPLTVLPKPKFDRIGAGPHAQGIAALIEEVAILELDDMLAAAREQDAPFYIALDSIYDPHNLGAIIRSAECAGAHGAVLPARDASVITDTAVKASAGAVSHLPVARVATMSRALARMKEHGLWIAGLDAEGDTDLFALDGARPLCLVVGSEGKGLRGPVRQACDMLVRIPMWGHIPSLNASVAAALALYEIRRKRL